eukprot:scaffold776_cov347-Pavlova_lutheri.AAC.22
MLDLLKFLDQVPVERTVPATPERNAAQRKPWEEEEVDSATSHPCCSGQMEDRREYAHETVWCVEEAEDTALKELEGRALLSKRSLLGTSTSEDEWFLKFLREEEPLQCA